MMSLVIRPGLGGDNDSDVHLEMSDMTSVGAFREAVEKATESWCEGPFDLYIERLFNEGHASLGLVFGVDYHVLMETASLIDRKKRQRQVKEHTEIMEKTLRAVGVRNHDVVAMVIRPLVLPRLLSSSESSEDSSPESLDTASDSSADPDFAELAMRLGAHTNRQLFIAPY